MDRANDRHWASDRRPSRPAVDAVTKSSGAASPLQRVQEVTGGGKASLSNVMIVPATIHRVRRATSHQPFGRTFREPIPVLIDILKDIPHVDFDSSLAWEANYWGCRGNYAIRFYLSSRRDFKPIRTRVPRFLSSPDIHHIPTDTSTLGLTLEEPQLPV